MQSVQGSALVRSDSASVSFKKAKNLLFFNQNTYTVEERGLIMAGTLQKHPYFKSYDELQRSQKRMNTYLDINSHILSDEEQESIRIMLEGIEKALRQVPQDYRITKHYQYKDKND